MHAAKLAAGLNNGHVILNAIQIFSLSCAVLRLPLNFLNFPANVTASMTILHRIDDAEISVCISSVASENAKKMRTVVLVQVHTATLLFTLRITNFAAAGPQPAPRCHPLPLSGTLPQSVSRVSIFDSDTRRSHHPILANIARVKVNA